MKLLQRTGSYFMGFSLLVLLLGSIGIFYGLVYMFDEEMDESLYHTREVLHKELTKRDPLPPVLEIMDEVIDIREVSALSDIEIYKDTLREVYDEEEDELELEVFRQYSYTEKINGKNYRVSLHHSKFEREDLLTLITALVIFSLLFFFLLLNLFNRFISKKLWKPFYHTIEQIRNFSLAQPNEISTIPTDIDEFNTLNEVLGKMKTKLVNDYRSLRQFTENASHESQTPLAIIQSQVELLLQQEMDEKTGQHLQQIQLSAAKLSKLNKSLLLLTRIENRQFVPKEEIALDQVIDRKLEALELLIAEKSIVVEKKMSSTVIISNPILMDVIVSNLLSNAINHNLPNGKIEIVLNTKKLQIRNLGEPPNKPTKKLFERFQKSEDAAKSVGLGLAIVKEICDVYGWSVEYLYEQDWHELKINF